MPKRRRQGIRELACECLQMRCTRRNFVHTINQKHEHLLRVAFTCACVSLICKVHTSIFWSSHTACEQPQAGKSPQNQAETSSICSYKQSRVAFDLAMKALSSMQACRDTNRQTSDSSCKLRPEPSTATLNASKHHVFNSRCRPARNLLPVTMHALACSGCRLQTKTCSPRQKQSTVMMHLLLARLQTYPILQRRNLSASLAIALAFAWRVTLIKKVKRAPAGGAGRRHEIRGVMPQPVTNRSSADKAGTGRSSEFNAAATHHHSCAALGARISNWTAQNVGDVQAR